MKKQTLLFVMSDKTPDTELQDIADHARKQKARVICLILAQSPTYPIGAYGALPYGGMDVPIDWIEDVKVGNQKLRDRSEGVKALLQKENMSGDVHPVLCAPSDAREIVASRALVSDTAALSKSLRNDYPELFFPAAYGVLLESPIGLIQNAPPLAKPKRIFLAWDTGLRASRAAHAALPLLRSASEVIVGCIDPHAIAADDGEDPGADLAKWLSHHGCNVTVNQYPSGGQDIATVMRRHAHEVGAELVVMGAYGRSRMREYVFGSTTRAMLDQTDTPVFLVH